jgi:hypothetical protein
MRHALRRWRRRPGLAIVATLILAIGIGPTTAMYSTVDAVLLKDEPWPHADRVVRVYSVLPPQRAANRATRDRHRRSGIGPGRDHRDGGTGLARTGSIRRIH